MRHDPASGTVVIMLRSLKMHGMAQAAPEPIEQDASVGEWEKVFGDARKASTAAAETRTQEEAAPLSTKKGLSRHASEAGRFPAEIPDRIRAEVSRQA